MRTLKDFFSLFTGSKKYKRRKAKTRRNKRRHSRRRLMRGG